MLGVCSSIRNQPLAKVKIKQTPVRDLSFIWNKRTLYSLELRETAIRDPSPLKNTGLKYLSLENNPVNSYAPMVGLPLVNLSVKTNGVFVPVNCLRMNDNNKPVDCDAIPAPVILSPFSFDFGERTEIERPVLTATLRNDGDRTVRVTDVIRT